MSKICFFDVDGTLIDSFQGIRHSLEQALRSQGLELPDEAVLRTFVGPPIERSIANHWKDLAPHLVKQAAGEFQRVYQEQGYAMGQLYPHMADVLEAIHPDWDLYVVTNKNVLYAEKTLQHFGINHYFKGILCTDRSRQIGKSQLIRSQLAQYDIVDQAVMIGDTPEDHAATEGNDCDFIGVVYGFGLKPTETYDFATAHKPLDLLPLLEQL